MAEQSERRKRKGRWSKREQLLLEAVDKTADIGESARALAPVLKRSPASIKAGIISARERLQSRAVDYVDIHHRAAQNALSNGDNDVAGRLAWQAIGAIRQGESTVIDAPQAQQTLAGIAIRVELPEPMGGGRALSGDYAQKAIVGVTSEE